MKKFVTGFILCLAAVQTTYAATSALTNSLLEQQAITTAIGTNPRFQDVIPPDQFIIDIERITKEVNNLGRVKYEILTVRVGRDHDESSSSSSSSSRSDNHRTFTYIATLKVKPHPHIGPRSVKVLSIKEVK